MAVFRRPSPWLGFSDLGLAWGTVVDPEAAVGGAGICFVVLLFRSSARQSTAQGPTDSFFLSNFPFCFSIALGQPFMVRSPWACCCWVAFCWGDPIDVFSAVPGRGKLSSRHDRVRAANPAAFGTGRACCRLSSIPMDCGKLFRSLEGSFETPTWLI
jgi:hypothetical protein